MSKASRPAPRRDGWVSAGIAVSAVSAAVSSFSGLRSLAIMTGWPVGLAPLLPLTVDAYAMTATRVWLTSASSERVRGFARWNAVAAIGLSVAGNATCHAIAAHLMSASWSIVLAVGSVPALVLGLVTHLAVLRGQGDLARVVRTEFGPGPPGSTGEQATVRAQSGPRYAGEDELLVAARAADQAHRERSGRPLSRDALRQELRVSGARATAVARQLRQEREADRAGQLDR